MGKTPYLEFKMDPKNKETLKFLMTLADDKKIRPYVKEAINRAGNKFVSTLRKEAQKKYKIRSQSYFNQFIKKKPATNNNLEYKINIRSSRLNMIRFAKLENRKIYKKKGGVTVVETQKVAKSVEIIRGRKTNLQTRGAKTWFVGNKGRTLFRRKKGEKKEIIAVSTISPTQMLGRKEVLEKANKEAEEVLKNRIEHIKKNFKF